ncbi:MAG: restriction endonuclease subunit S [Gammaproteobacteria bacterium]|nr:restriction endonuclease subunit S [Gammaproteobacteria bacterium]
MSIVAWTDQMPNNWEVRPLRSVVEYVVSNVDKKLYVDEIPVRLCNYTDVYNNEFITMAVNFMQATASEAEITKFGVTVNDVIITKDSESPDDIGVPALVRETACKLVCGYHLALLRPLEQKIDGSFLFRCLQAKPIRLQLELAANGITRFGIPKTDIGAMRLPIPPLVQQHAIVNYLDREMSRLDALVAAKERVLKLLAEKRRALITRAVVRGLDPCVPLRDSGIPWLGEIPEKWKTERVAWLFFERDQRGEPDLPLLEVSIKAGVVVREFSEERIESTAADFNTYKIVRQGEVVFNKMRMWQGAVGVAPQDGLVSPDYVVVAPNRDMLPNYAGLLFRIDRFSAECARRSHGIVWDRMRLYWGSFRDIDVPVPPAEAQREIVEYVIMATAKLDELTMATESTIELLKERRTALISAAVTGLIGVESAA